MRRHRADSGRAVPRRWIQSSAKVRRQRVALVRRRRVALVRRRWRKARLPGEVAELGSRRCSRRLRGLRPVGRVHAELASLMVGRQQCRELRGVLNFVTAKGWGSGRERWLLGGDRGSGGGAGRATIARGGGKPRGARHPLTVRTRSPTPISPLRLAGEPSRMAVTKRPLEPPWAPS